MGLPVNLAITNSSYFSLDKENPGSVKDVESWTTLRTSVNVPLGYGGTASVDYGVKTKIDFSEGNPEVKYYPAFEAKYNQKLYSHDKFGARMYVRFRNSEGSNQLRFAAGGSYKVDEVLSLYADVHYTLNGLGDGKDGVNRKAGIWVGGDWQLTPKDSVGCEFGQGNIDIKTGKTSFSTNIFYKHNF